jgi:hypothetical protein
MAGEQVDWAALMPITASAVLLADGMNGLAREIDRGTLSRWAGLVAGSIGIALSICLFTVVGGSALMRMEQWRSSQPVNLQGSQWLRLRPVEAARLTSMVTALAQNCRTVLMLPGLYSFSIWSGVPPLEQRRINGWPFWWPDEVLEHEMRDIRDQDDGCVLVSRDVYEFFKRFAVPPGNDALLLEVQRTMRPIHTVRDMTLYRPFP